MITLVVLDGFGFSKQKLGNAIESQGTPNLDKLKKQYPHTLLEASGEFVGLPKGTMGGSEVGHLTMGAGRVVLQDLQEINNDIETGKFAKNPALNKALSHAEKNKGNLHIAGLFSDIGVHATLNHVYAILDHAKNFKIQNIYLHAFTDGRDSGTHDAAKYIEEFERKTAGTNARIATLVGRVYAMGREKRYDRLQVAYDMLFDGKGEHFDTAMEAIKKSYADGETDEFVKPKIVGKDATIKDGDSFIFYNFRSDRARELTDAITNPDFKEFKTKKLSNFLFTAMKEYDKKQSHLNIMYPPTKIDDNLAAILSKNGKTQFHISETTKYAHVTFFFNGGNEKPYKGEERQLVDSINTPDFSNFPKMRAPEITEGVLNAIASAKYDFILVNFSNPDMIGHTGNFGSTKKAIEYIDKCAYAVALATLMAGGECIITADHGNAEFMFDKKGNKITTHTCNKVPFILVSRKHRKAKLKKNKSIANIASTILKLMDLPAPATYFEPLF